MLVKRSVNSYHNTASLLFQFVLYEYLMALKQTAIIETFSEKEWAEEKVAPHLIKMAGSEQEFSRIFSGVIDSGILTKLKNYADLLSERAEKGDADFVLFHSATQQAWVDCLHTVDLIRRHHPVESLKKSLKKTLASLKKIHPAIKRIIPKYAQDENVLYFILRNQESFDKALGAHWTRRLLLKLHPKGLLMHMKKAYEKRGFESLIPPIAEAIKNLHPKSAQNE